ncbi:hypothetical protein CPR19081_DFPECDIO_01058 [Companilactobacillus paralimentarius]|uniref:hypothetical protein n=1 Tax=Companilactobacillus paralimentarius TaxID=83526 RepID=UPI00384E5160
MTTQNNNQVETKEMEVTYKVNGEPIRLTANMVQSFLANGNSRITQRNNDVSISLQVSKAKSIH